MSSAGGDPGSAQAALGPQDDRPLTQQEYQMLQRLLSDPFSIPIQFKTWLVSYLSASDLSLPMNSVVGLTGVLGITGLGGGVLGILPAGIVLPYGGDIPPSGSVLCDGASYANTLYPNLRTVIGTKFGGDANNFLVPDIAGRMIVMKGSHTDVNALGLTEQPNQPLPNRRPRHRHTVNDSGHAHGYHQWQFTSPDGGPYPPGQGSVPSGGADLTTTTNGTGISVGPQSGAEPVDSDAYIVLNMIITAS